MAKEYHTDGYRIYKSWLNRKQHKISKFGKTNRNEGLHSRLRDRLKRLQRKTKEYSKNINALRYALAIVFSLTNIPTDFSHL
ncbi:IS1 family transposase [Venenivibrio stagnispumantis]|uniref:IS1 family transposase n=1 Tax=Venenivibrio stagnispumantis TaxID=407998 RepID=UPI003CE4A247